MPPALTTKIPMYFSLLSISSIKPQAARHKHLYFLK
nr:MAG TPA: hypothetical protein [Caudoviricetes sp.]